MLLRLLSFCLRLLLCNCLRIADQLLLMLLTHVVNLHAGQRTKCECLLKGKTRMIGMNMHFDDLVIRNNDNAVTDILKICLQLLLHLILISLKHYDKFGTITKLNICRILRGSCRHCR